MSIVQAWVTFAVSWCIMWLIVLPFGVRREESPEPGHSTGAPKPVALKKRLLISCLLAIAVTIGIKFVLESGWIQLDVYENDF